ncbi:MAG TPA: hypothetical protein VHF06_10585 [Pseudonocardiaceae bacterium]|jgi:hypothetical protein|nr:hypothetical protein [Pseudonocardiaceae bacterium]
MHVVVTEAAFGESASVVDALRAAGHQVSACHDRSGLCQALRPGRRCPLDRGAPADLMVDVRGQEPELTAREFGVVCAVRERVPVAVVGVDPLVPPRVPEGLRSHVTVATVAGLLRACRDAEWIRRQRQPRSHRRPLPAEVAW